MAIACQPSALLAAAKCISCLAPQQRRAVSAAVLCQIASNGGMSGIATPTGFTFLPSDTSGNTVVASWNAPPSGVTGTEVWTSTDNVHFILNRTVAAPGTTTTPSFIQGNPTWCQIRWVTATAQSQFTPSILIPAQVPVWLKAVVTNGGAQVSLNTALAVNTFAIALVNGGIDTLMQAVNVYAPDNLTAARTPLYKTFGLDPWNNNLNNFVAGDLSVNGLTGDASTKALDTGVISTTAWQNTGNNVNASTSGGISLYTSTLGTVASGTDVGSSNNAISGEIQLSAVFTPTSSNNLIFDFTNNSTDRISGLNTGWTGFISANRTSGSASAVYMASSTHAFSTFGTNATNVVGHAMPVQSFCAHGFKNTAGTITPNSNRTISFVALHLGLTSAQAQALFNAVQALRVAFGGGFV